MDLPAGSADRGATEALVRVAARGRSAADIARIPVKRADTTTIFVGDLAQVVDGVEQPKNLALLDTTPALALDVLKQSGANTVEVADGIARDGREDGTASCRPASRCRWCATTRPSSATPSTT